MATRTTTQSGPISDSATFGGSAFSDGDIVVVATGHTLTIDQNCILGSNAGAAGDALVVQATDATTFGKVVVNDGVTLTLRGVGTASNRLALINRYALFEPQPGATIYGDCASDYAAIIDNRGRFEAVGTALKNVTLLGNATWSTQITNEAKSFSSGQHTYDKQLGTMSFLLAQHQISNAAGDGPGSLGDSSLSFSSVSPAGHLTNEVASIAALSATGDYYVDYEAGIVFVKDRLSITCNATYKYGVFIGWGVESLQNTTYNTAIFDYVTFRHMGSKVNADQAAIRVTNKQSASVAANRLFRATNCTVEYSSRWLSVNTCTGTADDMLQVTDNTIRQPFGGNNYGDAIHVYRNTSSYVNFSNNNIAVRGTVLTMHSSGQDTSLTGWKIQNNTGRCGNFMLGAPSVLNPAWGTFLPDAVMSGNTFTGYGLAIDGFCLNVPAGKSGQPFVVRNNTFRFFKRVLSANQYVTFDGNITHDVYHHTIVASNTQDIHAPGVRITNNLLVGGSCDTPLVQLGYNRRAFIDAWVIANNTMIGGGIELGDRNDNNGCSAIMNATVVNNVVIDTSGNPWPYGLYKAADTATFRSRAQVAAIDHNLIFTTGDEYSGLTHQAIFARSGTRYNTDATRNVLGVMLWDSSAASGPTNKSLVFTYTSATDQTLAWDGGAAAQLVLDSGTATAGSGTSLTDSSQSWPTAFNDADCPKCHWVRITGGTGAGQERMITNNTATVLTIAPAWTTTPDATSTYTIIKSEVQLFDSGATDYVRAGIDARDLPETSQTDTGIDVTYTDLFDDPLTSETGVYDYDPTHYQFGASSPAVDAGVDIASVTDDYFGTARDASPDIGFYEYAVVGQPSSAATMVVLGIV